MRFLPHWTLVLALGLAACSGAGSGSSGVIPQAQMEKILWDMIQADQYASNYAKKEASGLPLKEEVMTRYDQVFSIHRVSREQFQKSLTYYSAHPDEVKTMMDTLSAFGARQRYQVYNHPLPKAFNLPPTRSNRP